MHDFRRSWVRRAALEAVLLGACLWAGSAAAQQAIGGAKLAENDVRGETVRGIAAIHAGDQVYQNEWVRTGAASLAQLALLDETNVSLGPSSQLKLDRFVYTGSGDTARRVVLDASKGAFRFFSGNSSSDAYQVTTPQATIGVRGTVYDVLIEGDRTRVVLQEGRALVCARATRRCILLTVPGSSVVVGPRTISGPISPGGTHWHFADLCRGNAQLCNRTTIARLDLGLAPPRQFPYPVIGGAALAVFLGVVIERGHHHHQVSP